jgi:hypothetical protein
MLYNKALAGKRESDRLYKIIKSPRYKKMSSAQKLAINKKYKAAAGKVLKAAGRRVLPTIKKAGKIGAVAGLAYGAKKLYDKNKGKK